MVRRWDEEKASCTFKPAINEKSKYIVEAKKELGEEGSSRKVIKLRKVVIAGASAACRLLPLLPPVPIIAGGECCIGAILWW